MQAPAHSLVDVADSGLAAWSETVREEERLRIAREVHDELGTLLLALKSDVHWLDKRLAEPQAGWPEAALEMRERLRGKCQDMGRLIESAVGNVGRIITDLRPSILDQGLWAALEWQATEFAQSAELELDWDMQVPEAPELAGPVAVAVLRIFQEMLNNVGRHARASRLAARIVGDPERLRITVEDNGIGAAPGTFVSSRAYGIMAMRERARHFGGQIAIASEPGRGSAFTLVLPLTPQVLAGSAAASRRGTA